MLWVLLLVCLPVLLLSCVQDKQLLPQLEQRCVKPPRTRRPQHMFECVQTAVLVLVLQQLGLQQLCVLLMPVAVCWLVLKWVVLLLWHCQVRMVQRRTVAVFPLAAATVEVEEGREEEKLRTVDVAVGLRIALTTVAIAVCVVAADAAAGAPSRQLFRCSRHALMLPVPGKSTAVVQ